MIGSGPEPVVYRREADPLSAFASESVARQRPPQLSPVPATTAAQSIRLPSTFQLWLLAIVIVVSGLGAMALRLLMLPTSAANAPQTGSVSVSTRPAGLPVFIDGEQRGITPLTLALSPGQHRLAVHGQGGEREVPLTIAAGADVTQYFDLQAVAPGDPGQVSIVTEPPGARATVNGRDFGITPVTVGNLAEGTHRVRVTNADATVERTVTVTAGGRTSAVFTLAQPSGPVGGYLTIATPFDVQVLEGGAVIGSSGVARIMIPSGRHDLVLTNRSLGYSERKTIEIQAGQLVALRVEPPMAPVSINARPWADVFVDGTGVGQTPIANIRLPLGSHRIMFRHPQLGDRMQTAIVTANEPNRFAVDFSK